MYFTCFHENVNTRKAKCSDSKNERRSALWNICAKKKKWKMIYKVEYKFDIQFFSVRKMGIFLCIMMFLKKQ